MKHCCASRTISPVRLCVALAAGCAIAAPATAHDTWLVAEHNQAAPGSTVRTAIVTAEQFPVSDHATEPDRVATWISTASGTREPVSGYAVEQMELAADVAVKKPGLYTIAVALKPRFIEIEAEGFQGYLEDERADAALELRKSRGQSDKPGREWYTKHCSTFVEVGEISRETKSGPTGLKLEIIPLSNPAHWKVGEDVEVKVLLDGAPAAGLRVSAGREGLPPHTFTAHERTDRDGRARFHLTHPGLWFLRTHTIRPTPPGVTDADWESFWSSITFRVAQSE